MAMELVVANNLRVPAIPEIKLARSAYELYAGQVLKILVVSQVEDQVNLNINGQNINARTAHHFNTGELLHVKVVAAASETVLQVVQDPLPLGKLHNALLQSLPRQQPANDLLALLASVRNNPGLTEPLRAQIQSVLNSVMSVQQLPKSIAEMVICSGYFMENNLAEKRMNDISRDFKGKCLQLLALLGKDSRTNPVFGDSIRQNMHQESLTLPGALPQPHAKALLPLLNGEDVQQLLPLIREYVEQALARINSGQLNHLMHSVEHPYSLMIDLPVQFDNRHETIPILIQEEQASPLQRSRWSFMFAVQLENLGAIQAKVIANGASIDVHINAELPATLQVLANHEEAFADLLAQLQLSLGCWTLKQGLEKNNIDTGNFRLLDIKI